MAVQSQAENNESITDKKLTAYKRSTVWLHVPGLRKKRTFP